MMEYNHPKCCTQSSKCNRAKNEKTLRNSIMPMNHLPFIYTHHTEGKSIPQENEKHYSFTACIARCIFEVQFFSYTRPIQARSFWNTARPS